MTPAFAAVLTRPTYDDGALGEKWRSERAVRHRRDRPRRPSGSTEGGFRDDRDAPRPTGADRFVVLRRAGGFGAALAALLAGAAAAATPASAAGPCKTSDGLDPDRDGLTCNEEAVRFGTDPLVYDTDFDGLGDGDEIYAYGTSPLAADTDVDGVDDGEEVAFGTDPLVDDFAAPPDSGPQSLLIDDYDNDLLMAHDELNVFGTDPERWDTDGDGYGDGEEVIEGSNPLDRWCDPYGCG